MDLKTIASKAVGGSPIINGKQKITTDTLIEKYHFVTVTAFDLIPNGDGTLYGVFNFAEDPDGYFNGGALATKVALAWADQFEGQIDEANKALADEGGVQFRISQRRTKAGKTITTFDPVD